MRPRLVPPSPTAGPRLPGAWLLCWLCLGSLLLGAGPLQQAAARETKRTGSKAGQDPKARAATLFAQGKAAFQAGDYRQALERFREANRLLPSFVLQFDIARCLERSGHLDAALAAFRLVVAHAQDPDLLRRSRERIRHIRHVLARTGLRVPDAPLGLDVLVDGEQRALDALGFLPLPPGRHVVRLRAPFFLPVHREGRLEPGQVWILRLHPIREPRRPAPTLPGSEGPGEDPPGP